MARAKKSGSTGPKTNPDPDVYVSLLFVSVAALLFGILFLVWELNNYAWTLG